MIYNSYSGWFWRCDICKKSSDQTDKRRYSWETSARRSYDKHLKSCKPTNEVENSNVRIHEI